MPTGSGDAVTAITDTTRVIAVNIPNIQGVRFDPWQNYLTSVNHLQTNTGFTFFTALNSNVAAVLRAKVDGAPPASITDFTPANGPTNTSVVVTGTNFTGATVVQFNGQNTTFTADSDQQITATVPPGATTGAISVIAAGGLAVSTNTFTVTPSTVIPPTLAIASVVVDLILKKSKQLLRDVTPTVRQTLGRVSPHARLLNTRAEATPQIPSGSVSLVVTSPPFLDVVDYAADNWLRCWFAGIEPQSVKLTTPRRLDAWAAVMTEVFRELHRVLKPGGHVAFEVGEVHGGKTKLEETVLPCGVAAGFEPVLVLINDQQFTKTANCWGVSNNNQGTNTNRVVILRKRQR